MPFQDVDLEKLYSYGRLLLTRLPKTDISERLKLDNEVDLQYYRLTKVADGDLVLEIKGEDTLNPTTEAGIKRAEDEKEKLSNIINVLNNKYGTDFTEADKLFFDQIEEELFLDDDLRKWANNNPSDAFKFPFDEAFLTKLIERVDANGEITEKILDNPEFRDDVSDLIRNKIYKRFNKSE
jgi:type I restriction enzyme R subunit